MKWCSPIPSERRPTADPTPTPSVVDVERYLERIGLQETPKVDVAGLEQLMRSHLSTVPFENLDVYRGVEVTTDLDHSLPKILDARRGGWCFEANGAFSALLRAIGFTVDLLGAAVLLGGPTDVIDHLCLEVTLDQPYLVDVGFGDGFCRPLALNRRGPQDGLSGTFELMNSPQGTTLTRLIDDVPQAQYRFGRVARTLADFEAASRLLQTDKSLTWHQQALATRLLDDGPDRVILVGDRLKVWRGSELSETVIDDDAWADTMETWFGFSVPLDDGPNRGGAR